MELPDGDTPALLNRRRTLGIDTPVFGLGDVVGVHGSPHDVSVCGTDSDDYPQPSNRLQTEFESTVYTDGAFDGKTTVNILLQRLQSGAHMLIDRSRNGSCGSSECGYYSTTDIDLDHLHELSSAIGEWVATDDPSRRRVRIGRVDAVVNAIDPVSTFDILLMKKGLFFEARKPYRENVPDGYQIIAEQIHLPCGETGDRSSGSLRYDSFSHIRTFKSMLDKFLEMNDYQVGAR